jgi:hypothetical protein
VSADIRISRKRTLRHGFQPKVLVGRASLDGRHFPPVPLQDFREREALRDSPIDDDTFVDLGFDAACPLLACVRLSKVRVWEGRPVRRILTRQNWPRFSMVAIGQFS